MIELPKSTAFGRIIAKERLYKTDSEKALFTKSVNRIRWINKIAPETMNILAGEKVTEIEVIELDLLDREYAADVIKVITKAIPYNLVFILNGKDYALNYNGRFYQTTVPPTIIGDTTDLIWEHIVRQISGYISETQPLDVLIENAERTAKLNKQIVSLKKKARSERQARRKQELVTEIKKLREELERENP